MKNESIDLIGRKSEKLFRILHRRIGLFFNEEEKNLDSFLPSIIITTIGNLIGHFIISNNMSEKKSNELMNDIKEVIINYVKLTKENLSNKNELLPCPFCKGRAEMSGQSDINDTREWSIQCKECFALIPYTVSKDALIKLWNSRTVCPE